MVEEGEEGLEKVGRTKMRKRGRGGKKGKRKRDDGRLARNLAGAVSASISCSLVYTYTRCTQMYMQ